MTPTRSDLRALGKEIITRLERHLDVRRGLFVVDFAGKDPFALLVSIVLSQNTSDRNSIRALLQLKERIGLRPEDILHAPLNELAEAIRPAGMQRVRAVKLKELAKAVLERKIDLWSVLLLPVERAREVLMSLPGVGAKSADVFLALHRRRTIGVDTHAARIMKRLGLVSEKASYEEIRRTMLELFADAEDLDYCHRLLIELGRRYCTARRPKCDECPLSDLCTFRRRGSRA